jgi:carbonic anhydrase
MYTHTSETRNELTPFDALQILKDGNSRFRGNLKANRDLLRQVNETSDGQWPFAIVLSCIDSRTSAELIFDQGLGDIFSVRIAGNFLNDDILGSMEFACHVAGAKLIVVLGHSHCGAIKGACDHVELGLLSGMLHKIQPSIDAVANPVDAAERSSSNVEFVDAVTRENVTRSAQGILKRSEVLRTMHESGTIEVVGGMYDVITGSVEFFSGVDADEGRDSMGNVAAFPTPTESADGSRFDESGKELRSELESAAGWASPIGTKLSSDPRFLDDVQDALQKAPTWEPWAQAANTRSLALVIIGLAGIGPAAELFSHGRVDFQGPAMMGAVGLLCVAALCWRVSRHGSSAPQKVRAIRAPSDTHRPR